MANPKEPLIVRVKERVDFIYNLATESADGYAGGFAKSDNLTQMIVRALVSRGVLDKERDMSKPRLCFIYKWASKLSPTKAFYKNISEDISKEYAGYKSKRKKEGPKEVVPTERPAKDTRYYVLEYSEAQGGGLFHFNRIRENEYGKRNTESMLYLNGYNPIAIIPDGSVNDELFERVSDFASKHTGRRFSRTSIVKRLTEIIPRKYMWTMKGVNVDLDALATDEEVFETKKPSSTSPLLSFLKGEDDAPAKPLSSYTSQQLWDELKSRGFSIEDGRLVQVVKSYLD